MKQNVTIAVFLLITLCSFAQDIPLGKRRAARKPPEEIVEMDIDLTKYPKIWQNDYGMVADMTSISAHWSEAPYDDVRGHMEAQNTMGMTNYFAEEREEGGKTYFYSTDSAGVLRTEIYIVPDGDHSIMVIGDSNMNLAKTFSADLKKAALSAHRQIAEKP
jgi:hypothetical protein